MIRKKKHNKPLLTRPGGREWEDLDGKTGEAKKKGLQHLIIKKVLHKTLTERLNVYTTVKSIYGSR